MSKREQYISILKSEEKRLAAELAAIRNLISITEGEEDNGSTFEKSHEVSKNHSKQNGIPKGKMSWDVYAEFVLNELGGKAKTQEAVDYASKANPEYSRKTILNAFTGKLSKLYRAKKIGAITDGPKSEGYEYFTKDWINPDESNNAVLNDFIRGY